MIGFIIEERQNYKNIATNSVSESIGGGQQINGIFLVIPYVEKIQ